MRALTVTALLAGTFVAAAPAAGAPQSCAELGGVVQAGAVCRVQASEPGYVMDITFPLGYPDEAAILDYLSQTRDGFVNVASTPDPRNHPFEMDVAAESLASAQTRSVVLTLFQDVGGAHPTTWFKAFTYDTVRGVPVTFDTLFAPGADPLDVIFPIVQSKLEADTGLAGSIPPGDGRDPAHYQNFAVTDESVVFYFARAELLPSYAGERSVTIPRSELPPLQV
jgi:hypothetical protein